MAALECREWEYRNSTDSIECSVSHFEYRFQFREGPDRPDWCYGGFMVVHIAEKGYLKVRCLAEQEDHHYYCQSQQEKFTAELRSQYPGVSGADAAKVTNTFMEILQLANAGHRCPDRNPAGGFFGTMHIIYFKIQPLLSQHRGLAAPAMATELVIIPNNDYCDDEEEEEEEEGWPRSQPATRASIMELLKKAAAAAASGDYCGGGECGICLEEIEPSPSLRMPCSHSFHRLCLLHWLNNSHSCPLCRYPMPAAQFRMSDHHP